MDSAVVWWIVVGAQALACSVLAAEIASKKGHSGGAWGLIGLVCGILGLIAAAGLPLRDAAESRSSLPRKGCPECAEPVRIHARLCPHCGTRLPEKDAIEELLRIVGNDEETASIAAEILVDSYGTRAVPGLVVLVRSRRPGREHAARALGTLKEELAVPALLERLAEGDERAKVAAESLAAIRDSSSVAPLLQVIERGGDAASYAFAAIEGMGPVAVEPLREAHAGASKSVQQKITRLPKALERT